MARIQNVELYPTKDVLIGSDRMIGSDSENQDKTVNFTVEGLAQYVSDNIEGGGEGGTPSVDQNNKIRIIELEKPRSTEMSDMQFIVSTINFSLQPLIVLEDEIIVFKISDEAPSA